MNREQSVIKPQDRRPIGFGVALRRAVMEGNARFEMIGGDDGPYGGLVEEFPGAADQTAVPSTAILLLHEQNGAALVEPSLEPCGVKEHQGHERVGGRRAESQVRKKQV